MSSASEVAVPVVAPAGPASGAAPVTFEVLYDAELDFVWRSLRGLGVQGAALDDAAQDVFLIAHRRLGSFEQRSSPRTWLYGIVRHVVLNRRRRWHRKEDVEPLPELLPSLHPTPERELEARQAWDLVARFLETLPDDQREVFVLSDLEEIPAPEVAAMTGAKLNTVYSRLRRARDAFRIAVARAQGGLR